MPGDLDVAAAVRRIREQADHGADHFVARSDADSAPETVVEGAIYRYPEVSADGETEVALTIYVGIGELGATLWRQEALALERIGSLGHGALPTMLDNGYLAATSDEPGVAFIRTRAILPTVDADGNPIDLAHFLIERPSEAVKHLWLLADALAAIHDCRIIHRNLWSGAVEYELVGESAQSEDSDVQARGLRVQLARFEMSGMFSNLLRSWRPGRVGPTEVRNFLLAQPPRSRVFASPERLRFIFGTEASSEQDFSGDVFGLGMVAVEWLLGPETLGDESDYGSLQSVLAAQERVRTAVGASDLPTELRSLISRMIDPTPPRPTAYDVVRELGRVYDAALVDFQSEIEPAEPYLVAYLPGEDRSDKTLKRWGYLSESSSTKSGEVELAELITSDMRGARLLRSEDGASPFVNDGRPDRAKSAKTVIEGRQFVWFLDTMFKQQGLQKRTLYPEIQIVRYVVDKASMPRSLETFISTRMSRVLPEVEAVSFNLAKPVHDAKVKGRSSWLPLLDSLQVEAPSQDALLHRRQAMEWYVDYQASILRSREYAYEVVDDSVPGRPQIVANPVEEQERARRSYDSLTRMLLDDPERLPLSDFIRSQEAEQVSRIEVRIAEEGSRLRNGTRATIDSVRGTTIVLRADGPIPQRGWIMVEADRASFAQVRAQRDAVDELSRRRDLLAQLSNPTSSPRGRPRWDPTASGKLVGEGATVVREMLAHETFFVLQGPPGTGKTTITAQAVAAYLRRERGARVLVSAQSHDALDNLAERILDTLGLNSNGSNRTHTAVRVASQYGEARVSARVSGYLERAAVEAFADSIKRIVGNWLSHRRTEHPDLVPILKEWLSAIDGLGLDLRLRLRRGANLVFATTGASTEGNLVARGSNEPFDWVIVEEAARAWPSELALPLTRGTRWTLVGDQAQIGAYGRSDVERLLHRLEHDPDPDLQALFARRADLAEGFDVFGGFFAVPGDHSWRHTLHEQYRMDERIAEVVSSAFYQASGGLDSPRGRRPHELRHPEWLRDEALVWIDSENRNRATPYWRNDAEARDVASIVRLLIPDLQRHGKSLAILTPYREQVDLLQTSIAEHAPLVSTIDAFQGREADVVIASMVRDHVSDRDAPSASAGHVADSGRANVLMSRARSLLIIIGNLDLYENHAGPEWQQIIATSRAQGRIVTLPEADLA